MYINRNFYDGVWYDSFTIQLTANTYYDILYEGYNGPAGYSVAVYWSSPSIFKVAIPSSAFVVPEIIGSSPIQVTVVCPTGYTGNDASSLYACKEIWGDGLRVGVEVWDDANIVTNDGCQSNWASITSGYVWSGGSTTSKDIWIQWTTGFYQNAAKTLQ